MESHPISLRSRWRIERPGSDPEFLDLPSRFAPGVGPLRLARRFGRPRAVRGFRYALEFEGFAGLRAVVLNGKPAWESPEDSDPSPRLDDLELAPRNLLELVFVDRDGIGIAAGSVSLIVEPA